MKTDDFVLMLSNQAEPVASGASVRRLGLALLVGLPLAAAVMVFGLNYGLRAGFYESLALPSSWIKFLFPASIAVAGLVMAQRLGRPGVALRQSWLCAAVPLVLVWALAVYLLATAEPEARPGLVWGWTWRYCLQAIPLMALPVFVVTMAAMRSLAPTRPALAGAAAGAIAGGVAATVYAVHCPEVSAPFLAIWYGLGMAVPIVVGALIGPRLLRW